MARIKIVTAAMGALPGEVISGMEFADAVFNPTPNSTDGVDQDKYMTQGNDWIRKEYPGINFITAASVR